MNTKYICRFQKYIIIYILFLTIVSLGVILPLNFQVTEESNQQILHTLYVFRCMQGTKLGTANDFGHTTLANLDSERDSLILWIHMVVAFLMFPAAIFLMRRFSIGLKMRDTSLKITRTLAIENIPQLVGSLQQPQSLPGLIIAPQVCSTEQIMEHFNHAYPGFEVSDIQVLLPYSLEKLSLSSWCTT
jgi:hypothetical protein